MKSFEELMEFVEEENIKFLRLIFFDVYGNQKNLAIMPSELPRALTEGISIDASAVAGFCEPEMSDLFLHPDMSTIRIVPWRPIDGRVARVFCDVSYPDGRPFEKDTRCMLKEAVKAADAMGVKVNFGPELEFYIFKIDENGRQTDIPIDQAGYLDCEPLDRGENVRREVCFTLVEMGITPEASHHEEGPGQNEIDFRYSDPLTTADNTATVKWAVRSICEGSGYCACFTPKPLENVPGNGMHINISAEGKDGTDYLMPFMAGIMKHIREITLFLNPTEESYARLGRQKAPSFISWGNQNRTQLIRIPASNEERSRMELRSPDPTANPYLAYMLLIYAGLEGIRENLTPGAGSDKNLYTADESVTGRLEKLPASFTEAAEAAEESAFVRQYVPEEILACYRRRG